ncbi:MAG: hypothetical protein LBK13_02990 [Spirochaetales bacterium]|jgi:hypothetical protein|nr:hypothetical protein [Spirochaetales bacterium]
MTNEEREVIPGLTADDVKEMADKVFNWTDGNRPQIQGAKNGFLNILQNGKSDISSSPVFVRKIIL